MNSDKMLTCCYSINSEIILTFKFIEKVTGSNKKR